MTSLMVSMIAFVSGVKSRLKGEEKGATMVEYGIMVAFIAVVVMGAVIILGPQIAALFTGVSAKLPAVPAAG
ncbi:Flp family type IVb pilin [Pseudarthrobacter sp. DSP2-3-2b1]|uniref:Flp family type IVb pilin n=1 Tax=Pseudarthrobacter sp. DSP2-3-2b1 TaxID=2804661 RepID=UPI003CF522D9